MRWILNAADSAQAVDMGGKARALAGLSRAKVRIPDWFVLRGDACLHCLGETGRSQLVMAETADACAALLRDVRPDEKVAAEVSQAVTRLCPAGGFLAVRSSGSDEDGPEHSFAGQLDSYLFVPPAQVADRIAAVWRSGFRERIVIYRKQHGLPLPPRPPAVLVQRMVKAEAAGVAFSADPVSGRRGVAVVSGVFGLGTALVSGAADADTWFVDRKGAILEARLAEKNVVHRADPEAPEGVRAEALPESKARQPVLAEEQVRLVAELARRCAAHFGRPQDIEWALEGGELFLLQSRPITSLTAMPDPDGVLNLWDNSNIAESYGGVTTPLTYSFARRAYEEVYREFCRLMAVPQSRIAENAQVFRCMIGLVRGRVYYNLLNWYRVLAMLPGFTFNRRFMEQMMGVKEQLPDELVSHLQRASTADRLRDGLHLTRTLAGLAANHFMLSSRIRQFGARLNRALRPPEPPFDLARPDELAAYYQELERQLLTRWDAPLVNDFLAMIFYGVLRKTVAKWCGDTDGTLQNNLLCGEGGIISAEPVRHVRDLAGVASRHPDLVEKLSTAPLPELLLEIERVPEFASLFREYLERFGDRCLDELKLESATLHEDPTVLLRSIGHLASRETRGAGQSLVTPSDAVEGSDGEGLSSLGLERQLRREAEDRATEALRFHPWRRLVFRWVLKHARARVRDRENLRFERTRLFGRVRRVFLALAREFHARDLIESPADIFYLEVDEILGYCDGTTTSGDLKALVKSRRAEFARFAALPPPADRFETRGPVHHGNLYQSAATGKTELPSIGTWKGIGCCPGVVRGPVRVVIDPRQASLAPGEILVAERTDPGWILLFASAAGLLVERGSLLSHSAIVSREMGLPSIVSIAGITRHLADGDEVEMNGGTGVVTVVRSRKDANKDGRTTCT